MSTPRKIHRSFQETIDRSQAWFWSKEWQSEEKKVQEEIKKKKLKRFEDVDGLIGELNKK